MELQEIVPGLWRWTAPHPEWVEDDDPESPDGWDRDVGCVLLAGDDATVLIDPLVPEDDGAWAALDAVVGDRGLPVVVLTTIRFHVRSRDAVLARYGGAAGEDLAAPPAGVEPQPFPDAGETMFWLPRHGTLVPGDRLLGDGDGGLRTSPESWTGHMDRPLTAAELRGRLMRLLDLQPERILVSHGSPVLVDAHVALDRALRPGRPETR